MLHSLVAENRVRQCPLLDVFKILCQVLSIAVTKGKFELLVVGKHRFFLDFDWRLLYFFHFPYIGALETNFKAQLASGLSKKRYVKPIADEN